jgi:kynureninase
VTDHFNTNRAFAEALDKADPLARFRSRFFIPQDKIYFDGNSLGLMSADGAAVLERVIEEWKRHAILAWTEVESPWLNMAERLGAGLAPLLGVEPSEVVLGGGTTINIHSLVSTLFEPEKGRTKMLGDALTFPTDIYALRGQAQIRGLDPDDTVVLVDSDDGRFLDEDRIIDMMTDDVAVAMLPAVLYRSSQLLDIPRLAAAARERGIIVGFDCSHSIGVVPHRLNEWGVDFAVGCCYKFVNGGPGCPAFLHLNKRHFGREPRLAGWFGYGKEKQFELRVDFEHERGAGGWQISSPGVLGMAPIEGSLTIIAEAGLHAIREKSVTMTTYFIDLIDALLPEGSSGIAIGTPRDPTARGGHVALEHDDAGAVFEGLLRTGVVGDLRPPNIIRLAPSPLYNRYVEIWDVVDRLRDIIRKSGD